MTAGPDVSLKRALFGIAFLVAAAGTWAQTPLVIRHNFTAQQNATELSYEEEVLRLVLEKSRAKYGPFELREAEGISQRRAFRELDAGNLEVISTMTDSEREAQATPIRFCIYKGLLGVRIGMGLAATVERLNSVGTLEQLREVPMGLVFDWPDLTIQRLAGLRVVSLPDFPSGLRRLRMGSFQLLPMGVVEVAQIARTQGLSMIDSWAVAYPAAYYFFVSRSNTALAERLNFGFEEALRDKSFDALFAKRIEPLLRAAQLEKRTIFLLKNPVLPAATPLTRRELWHPLVWAKLPG